MSMFDARVVTWAKDARIRRDKKMEVLAGALKSIEDYENLGPVEKMHVKVTPELKDEINAITTRLREDVDKYGGESLDEDEAEVQARVRRHEAELERKENAALKGSGKGAAGEPADAQEAQEELGTFNPEFQFGAADNRDEPAVEEIDDDGNKIEVEDMPDGEYTLRISHAKSTTRRKTVSSEVITKADIDDFKPSVHPKSDEDAEWLARIIENEYLFEHLEADELSVLVNAMEAVELEEGDALMNEGEQGNTYYVVQSGELDVTKEGETVRTLAAEACFGEEELMYSAVVSCTVTATGTTKCWSLDRLTYRIIVTKASMKKRAMYEDFLSNIDFLKGLMPAERLQVADALKPTEYRDGDTIIAFGEEGTHFHIIVTGTVKVIGREGDQLDGAKCEVCTFTVGDCVGELEFINKHPTCADVVAVGPVKTAKMGRRHFEKVMGPVEEFLKERAAGHEKFAYYRGKQL
ncbi:cAMP-dependent protein kinase regulatory subunit [Diplonema papillatum]|nr:cAMP-dependent protein kinase regulatory subunit [Diplonema papillatum]